MIKSIWAKKWKFHIAPTKNISVALARVIGKIRKTVNTLSILVLKKQNILTSFIFYGSFYVEVYSLSERNIGQVSPAGITQINTTEAEGRRELAQHCVLPSLAGGRLIWQVWFVLWWTIRTACPVGPYRLPCRSGPPALSVRTACPVGTYRWHCWSIPLHCRSVRPVLSVHTACPVDPYRLPLPYKLLAIPAATAAYRHHWYQTFQAAGSVL
jgi:hypothetical protein